MADSSQGVKADEVSPAPRRPALALVSSAPALPQGPTAEASSRPVDRYPSELFQALAWWQAVTGLETFLGLREEPAGGGVARFDNGEISLEPDGPGVWVPQRALLKLPGSARPVVFDAPLLRMAVAFRLSPFCAAHSDPSRGRWTFGEPKEREGGAAVLLRTGTQSVLTLRPGTAASCVLKDAPKFVSPTFLVEDLLEHVSLGRILRVERQVVRCEDGDVLLSQVRPDGAATQSFVASAVRFAGGWPIPLSAFHLATRLDLGTVISAAPGEPLAFERGRLELAGGQVVAVHR